MTKARFSRTPSIKVTPEFFETNGRTEVQWRCTYCGRIYISKFDAEQCCKGKPRNVQVTSADGEIYYLNEFEYK